MSHASFRLEGVNTNLTVTATTGEERLGQGHHFELELASDAPVDAAAAIEQPCVLQLQTPFGEGHYHGIVAAITQCATADGSAARRCRLTMTSSLSLLEHSRRRRIFRNKNAAAVVATLMEEAGLDAAADGLSAALVDYPHLTQYDESDRRFIRRLLEQDGLWLRNESDFDSDSWTLCDAVAAAPDLGELLTVDEAHLRSGEACAVDVEVVRRLAPGKVALRGYHADNPNHTLQAEVAAAGDAEETLEVYRSRDQSWGHSATTDEHLRSAAERHLHGLRAEAKLVRWRCNVPLRAGRRLSLTGEVDLGVFIVSVRHHFDHDADTYHCDITATPTGQPYRLPPTTQKPRIDGAAYAVVTGSAGEEIHCDALGRVNVRFTWDRSGPSDHHSSLPVRVLHPNLAGSLLIPRVGWEVLIMFEDGDPDRPYVLGRLDNGKHRPAAALPANKTMTRLATFSSPGGNAQNAITFEDAAGRQCLALVAGKGLSRTVTGSMLSQTVNVEEQRIGGDQSSRIGASQTTAIASGALVTSAASQLINIAGDQSFQTPKAFALQAGSVSVTAASLNEQVGSAGGGLGDLAKTAAFTAVGSFGGGKGMVLAAIGKAAMAYQQTGAKGAAVELVKTGVSLVPGADVAMGVAESGGNAPWQAAEAEAKGGAEDASVAAGGAQGAGGADSAGGGKRLCSVGGGMTELIGGAYTVSTPGSSSWTTLGVANVLVAGSHCTTTGMFSFQCLGAASVNAAALNITAAGSLIRSGRLYKLTVAGALSSQSGADTAVTAGAALKLSAGSLKLAAAL